MKLLTYILIPVILSACGEENSVPENADAMEEIQSITLDLQTITTNDKVEIGPLVTQSVSTKITATGRLQLPPNGKTSVHSKISGYAGKVRHIPGDFVKKGELLATLTHPNIIEKQRIFLETKSELDLATKDFLRKKILHDSQATSDLIFENAEAQKELLQVRYEGLKNELEVWGIEIPQLEQSLKYQKGIAITAPRSGLISEISIHPGQLVNPENPIFEIVDNNELHLELQILAKYAPYIAEGQQVTFSVPGSNREHPARIIKINPNLNEDTETLTAHAHLEKHDGIKFFPGLYVNATIQTDSTEVTGLPSGGVIKEGEIYYAYVIEGSDVLKKPLQSVKVIGDMVTFSPLPYQKFITRGAYYIE